MSLREVSCLPSGWGAAAIDEIAETASGGTPSRSGSGLYGGSIPWVKSGELRDGLVTEISETITQEGLDSSSAKMFPAGTLCIALYGATVGKLGILGVDAATNQAVCGISPSPGIDTKYLFYFLRNARQRLIEMGKGGAQPNISQAIVRGTEVLVPPINEQRRIVAKIEELTERSRRARETLAAVPPLLEQLRQAALASAFSGRLTADWRKKHKDVEPATVLLERIRAERRRRWEENELAKLFAKGKEPKDDRWKAKYKEPDPVDPSGLPDLPEGWRWSSIGELADVGTGATPRRSESRFYQDGQIPWVTSGALNSEVVRSPSGFVTEAALNETNLSLYSPGTLLVAMYGEGQTRGRCAELSIDATTNQAIAAITTTGCAIRCRQWIKLCLWNQYLELRSAASGGVQPNLNLSIVKGIKIPLPPWVEQDLLTNNVKEVLESIDGLHKVFTSISTQLNCLDQSILAKAFRGELVPQDPSDEPASVLLERIRAQRAVAEADKKKKKSSRPSRLRGKEKDRKDVKTAKNSTDDLQTVLYFLQTNPGPHTKTEILNQTNLDPTTWQTLAPQLNNHPQIHRTGQKRGTRYEVRLGN